MTEPLAFIDDATVLDLATAADPFMRVTGRWLATGVHDTVQRFINTELQRGTAPADLLMALQGYFAQIVASFLFITGDGRDATDVLSACAAGYHQVMEKHFVALGRMGTPEEVQLRARQQAVLRKAAGHG